LTQKADVIPEYSNKEEKQMKEKEDKENEEKRRQSFFVIA